MFSAFKDSAYFSKVCGLCLGTFGVELMSVDKALNGQILATTAQCRKERRSLEEAATRCIAKNLRFLARRVDTPRGNSPNHAEYARWAAVVEGWLAQGLIQPEAYNQFVDTVLAVLDSTNRD